MLLKAICLRAGRLGVFEMAVNLTIAFSIFFAFSCHVGALPNHWNHGNLWGLWMFVATSATGLL